MIPERGLNGAPELTRVIGRWALVALAVNSILGSGIFGLPSVLFGLLGNMSPLAVLLAGIGMAVIVACYAEVASQFTETGGTYLYVRTAFGRLAGLQAGWMTLLSRLSACAAATNLLVAYIGTFWASAIRPVPRLIIISGFLSVLAGVNYYGVGVSARINNASVVAKLLILVVVSGGGLVWLSTHARTVTPVLHPGLHDWLQSMLLLLFAYGGYEAALNPTGETRNPRRDIAFALFVALVVLTALYSALQYIVIGLLPDPASSNRPLADAASASMGPFGAALVSVGAIVSICGYACANFLTAPRGMFALAERGDFPQPFAAVHPRFHTPYIAIVVFALLVWLFAQFADFSWNVTLSAVTRILYYGAVCAAVPVLRRIWPCVPALRLPGGLFLPVLGVLICTVLLTCVDFSKSSILLATVGIGLVHWALVRD